MTEPKPALDLTNPKDLVGQSKIDLSLFPPAGHIHGAHAFMDGARKYGAYNWREKKVKARVYISAAQRHLADFLDGEDQAQDSGAHHLGHAIACCAIILDALETGNLIDDRPVNGAAVAILDRLNAAILARQAPPAVDPVPLCRDAVVTAGVDVQADEAVFLVRSQATGKLVPQVRRIVRQVLDEVDPFSAEADGDPLELVEPTPALVEMMRLHAEVTASPDCGCAAGVRCHATFKPACPRLAPTPAPADCRCLPGKRCKPGLPCPRTAE